MSTIIRATRVPVGEDQLQHIQLAQHLARVFNNKYGPVFPRPKAEAYGEFHSFITANNCKNVEN